MLEADVERPRVFPGERQERQVPRQEQVLAPAALIGLAYDGGEREQRHYERWLTPTDVENVAGVKGVRQRASGSRTLAGVGISSEFIARNDDVLVALLVHEGELKGNKLVPRLSLGQPRALAKIVVARM